MCVSIISSSPQFWKEKLSKICFMAVNEVVHGIKIHTWLIILNHLKIQKSGFTETQTSRSRRPEHPARTVAKWTSVPVEKTKAALIIYYHRSITIGVDIKCTQTNPFVKHTKSDLSTFQLFQLSTALSNIEKGPTRCEPQFIVGHNSYRERVPMGREVQSV